MFPWVYGFTWDVGNVLFLGIFFSVVAVIAGTVTLAVVRTRRDHAIRAHETIQWQVDFHDLPQTLRTCRHELTGELMRRTCPNGFDCRVCDVHRHLLQRAMDAAPAGTKRDASRPTFVAGFQMPLDRLYHRGHTWVRLEADGTATVGLDDFAARMFGTPEKVDLPSVGAQVHVNRSGWKMRHHDSIVRVLSPLDGTVIETGGPEQGWYLKVRPLTATLDTRHLLHGEEVYCWIAGEIERVGRLLEPAQPVPTMADGGELVTDPVVSAPDADWEGIWSEVFLEP
jgi:hypothetical protein